jgi:glycosyltransferase involved in cell wall biosynthesis
MTITLPMPCYNQKRLVMNSSRLFSFVIPALNEEACIEACVRSIQAQREPPFEIIVVDNGSVDATVEIAERLGCRVVHEEKLGLSHARNRGAEVACGDILGFIDADCILSSDWLRAARQCFTQTNIGAISGLSIYVHPNPIKVLWYNQYGLFTSGGAFLSSILFSRMIFAGNNLAIRRQLFLQIGGYEDVIGEGMWLSRRFWKLTGYKGKLCVRMILWNSPRGFEQMGFLSTILYWINASFTRKSQTGYTYKSRSEDQA